MIDCFKLANYKTLFAELVVSSVEKLDTDTLDKDMIGIKLVTGGSITEREMLIKCAETALNSKLVFNIMFD